MQHTKRNTPTLCSLHQDELNARAVQVADAFETWIGDADGTARPGGKDSACMRCWMRAAS